MERVTGHVVHIPDSRCQHKQGYKGGKDAEFFYDRSDKDLLFYFPFTPELHFQHETADEGRYQ
jgi:hypothetical protein